MKALFDTNILIDYLNGIGAARNELALYEQPMISSYWATLVNQRPHFL